MNYALETARIATPIGTIEIVGDGRQLSRIAIVAVPAEDDIVHAGPLVEAIAQLQAYFAGTSMQFDLPLAPLASARGMALRQAMAAIPYGETLSYGALARLANSGPRAIGQACARNPFPIVIPCHRVLAAGGRLGAYSAGEGPATKQWLLDHEMRPTQERMFA